VTCKVAKAKAKKKTKKKKTVKAAAKKKKKKKAATTKIVCRVVLVPNSSVSAIRARLSQSGHTYGRSVVSTPRTHNRVVVTPSRRLAAGVYILRLRFETKTQTGQRTLLVLVPSG
jgi:hypothetical protein